MRSSEVGNTSDRRTGFFEMDQEASCLDLAALLLNAMLDGPFKQLKIGLRQEEHAGLR